MTWVVDGRTFARKVKNPTYGVHGHCGRGKSLECPACGFVLDESNLTPEWPGLPAGVKFDPSDQELLEHLAAKVGLGTRRVHPFIDEFIPTLDEEDGICYTHPEKLPGIRYDGSSIHFFHRPARAYTTGTRKRRKVQVADDNGNGVEMRWHKTGKTRPVLENGKQIGCKKIMVLYVSLGKKSKPDKTYWVMHQYHLGVHEDEKEGELVVSKIFYQTQPRQCGVARKEDIDESEHVALESLQQQAHSYHQSSPSTLSNSNISNAVPSPKTPGPFHTEAIKQPKGLLATITEDVERLKASLSSRSQNTRQSSDQSIMGLGDDSIAFSYKSAGKVQGSVINSPSLGEMDTHSSVEERMEKETGKKPEQGHAPNVFTTSLADEPSLECHQISDVLDPYVLKLLRDENLDITLKLKGGDEGLATSLCGASKENGRSGDETVLKMDSLENILLDTPPEFSLESLGNSQEMIDWLSKRKFWSDSSQKTDDGSFLDFLKDSQSSV